MKLATKWACVLRMLVAMPKQSCWLCCHLLMGCSRKVCSSQERLQTRCLASCTWVVLWIQQPTVIHEVPSEPCMIAGVSWQCPCGKIHLTRECTDAVVQLRAISNQHFGHDHFSRDQPQSAFVFDCLPVSGPCLFWPAEPTG